MNVRGYHPSTDSPTSSSSVDAAADFLQCDEEVETEEAIVRHVLAQSLEENDAAWSSPRTLDSIFQDISQLGVVDECLFEVRQEHVCLQGVERCDFDPTTSIKVAFVGEGAEDGGGP